MRAIVVTERTGFVANNRQQNHVLIFRIAFIASTQISVARSKHDERGGRQHRNDHEPKTAMKIHAHLAGPEHPLTPTVRHLIWRALAYNVSGQIMNHYLGRKQDARTSKAHSAQESFVANQCRL